MLEPPPFSRTVFLSGEGDAWFQRNQRNQQLAAPAADPLLPLLLELYLEAGSGTTVVEVGCVQGWRLQSLANQRDWAISGLDPSAQTVGAAEQLGVDALVGPADSLSYSDRSVDLLVFGFCLYLCDQDHLFKIAAEAHRVLKPESWLAILDFWSPFQRSNPSYHKAGVLSFKSNLPAMFAGIPIM